MKYLAVLLLAAAVSAEVVPFVPTFSHPESRITNGTLATPELFPWQAGLYVTHNDGTEDTMCGGALVATDLVLTAAHCLHNVKDVIVCLGSSYFCDGGSINIRAGRHIVHSGYDSQFLRNDVALIRLQVRAPINDKTIKIIQLPQQDSNIVADECLYVSGFGKTLNPSNNRLNYISVKSITNEDCRKTFPSLGVNQMCTKRGQQKSTCSGDSGGPLVKFTPRGPIHVGVVSFVHKTGCDKNLPMGFMRTAKYINWLQETAKKLYE